MSRGLAKLLKELEAVKRDAVAKGRALQTVSVSAAVDNGDADQDEAPRRAHWTDRNAEPSVTGPVMDYLIALQRLPRQLLMARYVKDVGEPAPNVARAWLIERMARKLQDERYLALRGAIPDSVLRNDRKFSRWQPVAADDDEDPDEPAKSDRRFDPTMRVKALVKCPWAHGKAWSLFQVVASQGDRGVQYNALVLLLEKLNDWPRAKAEAKAQKVFTRWVDEGYVELV